jgi:hypothetical protein
MPYCTRAVKREEDLRPPIEQAEQLFVALKQVRWEVRAIGMCLSMPPH